MLKDHNKGKSMSSFSSLARALELKASFSDIAKKQRVKFSELTMQSAESLISSNLKNKEILSMCEDYLKYSSVRIIKETTQ